MSDRKTEKTNERKTSMARTIGNGALLEGRVVQARLLRPCRKRCWGQIPLRGHCACPRTVRFWWQSTWQIYYGGSIFILKLCLGFTSFPSLQGNSPLRSSRAPRQSIRRFPDELKGKNEVINGLYHNRMAMTSMQEEPRGAHEWYIILILSSTPTKFLLAHTASLKQATGTNNGLVYISKNTSIKNCIGICTSTRNTHTSMVHQHGCLYTARIILKSWLQNPFNKLNGLTTGVETGSPLPEQALASCLRLSVPLLPPTHSRGPCYAFYSLVDSNTLEALPLAGKHSEGPKNIDRHGRRVKNKTKQYLPCLKNQNCNSAITDMLCKSKNIFQVLGKLA